MIKKAFIKIISDDIEKNGIDHGSYALSFNLLQNKKYNELAIYLSNLDTTACEKIMDTIYKNNKEIFYKIFPNAKCKNEYMRIIAHERKRELLIQ
jgi:hypothetical protein